MWVYRIEIRTKIYLALKMKVSNHKKIDLYYIFKELLLADDQDRSIVHQN